MNGARGASQDLANVAVEHVWAVSLRLSPLCQLSTDRRCPAIRALPLVLW